MEERRKEGPREAEDAPEGYEVIEVGTLYYPSNEFTPQGAKAETLAWRFNASDLDTALAAAKEHAAQSWMVVFGGTKEEKENASCLWLESTNVEDAVKEVRKLLMGDPSKWTLDYEELYDAEDYEEVKYNGHEPLILEWGGKWAAIVEVKACLKVERWAYDAETARERVREEFHANKERQEYERLKAIYGD